MKRKISAICVVLCLVSALTGCGLADGLLTLLLPDMTEAKDLPHLMVQRIDISMHPQDEAYERHYQTQDNLTATLELLRDMATMDFPEEEPKLTDGQTYYSIVATYANGAQRQYYILGYRYLKVGDEPWCEISFDQAMEFTQFIAEHQSDDGSYTPPPTTIPPETTLPPETGGTVPPTT